jgi:hypothetical protein
MPDGTRGRIFDRARAAALMDRTDIAFWDPTVATDVGYPPGRLLPEFRSKLKALIRERLMDEAELAPGETVQGYVVADTMYPLASFENVSLKVVARRIGDGRRIRGSYTFAVQDVTRDAQ